MVRMEKIPTYARRKEKVAFPLIELSDRLHAASDTLNLHAVSLLVLRIR